MKIYQKSYLNVQDLRCGQVYERIKLQSNTAALYRYNSHLSFRELSNLYVLLDKIYINMQLCLICPENYVITLITGAIYKIDRF